VVVVIDELADHIAFFHAAAERHLDRGGAAEMADIAQTQHQCLAARRQAGFVPEHVDELLEKWRERLAAVAGLLDRRRATGKVRHCHGDLHLRNICLVGGTPTLHSMPSLSVWFAIVITGVFASAIAFYIQTWAQAHLDASRTALILATEPAWALVAAVVLAGQRLDAVQAAGAALVLAAIVGHELVPLLGRSERANKIGSSP